MNELGARVAAGLRVRGVPTSARSEGLARALGIPLLTLDDVARLDLGIDGADEIDPHLNLVKGRGGALLYEKLVALTCDDYIVVAATEKLVDQLGTRVPLPVEIVPFGWEHTAARLAAFGANPRLRLDRPDDDTGGPFISDGGHYVLDCATGPIADPPALAATIKAEAGVVDHGLFLGVAKRAMVVDPQGQVRTVLPA